MFRSASSGQNNRDGRSLNDIGKDYGRQVYEEGSKYRGSPRIDENTRQGPLKGSPVAFNMSGPSKGSPMAFKIVSEITNARRLSPRFTGQERHGKTKDLAEGITDEGKKYHSSPSISKETQRSQQQVAYSASTDCMVEAAQSLGCTSAGETGSSIAQCNIGEADSFMDLAVPCRNDAAACDKQQSSSSSAVSGPVAGDETDVVRSECDQTNEDTVDRIIMAPPTIVEKEMDDMFKEGIYPTIQEVTEALEPEGGMVFGSLDECFLFFCRYARKVGFAAKRSTSRRSTYDQQLDKQVFQCTKEGQNKTTERHVKERRSNCLIRTSCPVQITAKRDTDRRKWYLKNVRLEHNHQLHPSDWMLKFMRCYKKMTPQEKFFIQVLQKARLEPRKVMQIFTAMGKPRREIMFDTIDISNIACRDRAGERGTDIADTMKLFADMQRRRPGFHHVEETENNVVRSLFWTDSLCVDNHGSTVLFGVGLLKDEKIGSFKWLLSTFVEAMGDQDEFERAWKAAISLHKAEGNKHLNTLWELRNFWVPAYFKDCFYPFSSTTTHSESTNSMWKNYVDHKDTIKRKEKAYRVLRECTVDMKIKVMAALAEEPDTGILAETLKNPPMSGSKGTKKGDRIKAGSEKKGKGNKAASKCGRCGVKGHRKTNCPDNPEVQERMRIEEEKRKSQQEKRARSMKWPTTPTTPSRTSNGSGQCTPSPGGRRQTPATPTTPLTAGSIYESLASTPKSNITQARQTECVQGSPGQGTESAPSIFRKERSEWRLFGTEEQYE
ncbi:hypothetical protein VPH35_136506 [Triticum aestivum]